MIHRSDLTRFNKEAQAVILEMQDDGWSVHLHGTRVMCKDPDGNNELMVHERSNGRALDKAIKPYRRWRVAKELGVEHPDVAEDATAALVRIATEGGWTAKGLVNGKTELRMGKHRVLVPKEAGRDEYKELAERIMTRIPFHLRAGIIDDLVTMSDEDRLKYILEPPEVETPTVEHTPSVVRRPWLAAKSPGTSERPGTRYPSAAVLEVVVDGAVAYYECSWEGCGYQNENPRSVATHYGRSRTHAESAARTEDTPTVVDPAYDQPQSHRTYTPSDRLVLALADYLREHFDPADSFEGAARKALEWAHLRPDLPPAEPMTTQPLSDEDIVARIRLLLDKGEVVAQRAEIDRLGQEVRQALEAAQSATQRAERAEGELAALAEMTQQYRKASGQ